MDEVDLAAELIELEAELQRRARGAAPPLPTDWDACRDCEEPLADPVLRAAGFCDRYCRDRFEIAQRLKKITGQAG